MSEERRGRVGRAPLIVYDPTRENALTHGRVNDVVTNGSSFSAPLSVGGS